MRGGGGSGGLSTHGVRDVEPDGRLEQRAAGLEQQERELGGQHPRRPVTPPSPSLALVHRSARPGQL